MSKRFAKWVLSIFCIAMLPLAGNDVEINTAAGSAPVSAGLASGVGGSGGRMTFNGPGATLSFTNPIPVNFTWILDSITNAGPTPVQFNAVGETFTIASGVDFTLQLSANGNAGNYEPLRGDFSLAAADSTLTWNPESVTYSGAIDGAGAFTLNATGETLICSGTHTYSGPTSIVAGRLQGATLNGLSGSSAFTIASPGELSLTASNSIGSLSGLSGTVNLGGGSTLTTGGDSTNTSFAGAIIGAGGQLVKTGTGTFILSGTSNSYSGGTTIAQGAVEAIANGAFGSGAIFLTDDGTSLILNDGITLTAPNNIGLPGNASFKGYFSINSGTATIQSIIQAPGQLVKTGSGILVLSATGSDYSGGTEVDVGRLVLAASSNLATSIGPIGSGTLTMHNAEVALSSGISIENAISLPDTGTFIVDSGTAIFAGSISGVGSMIKSGGGTLNLSGSNPFEGAVDVSNGILQFGSDNPFSDSTFVVLDASGTLDLNDHSKTIGTLSGAGNVDLGTGTLSINSGDTTYSGIITGTGQVELGGAGGTVFQFSGQSTYSGTTTLRTTEQLTLNVSSTGSVTSGPVGVGTLSVEDSCTITLGDGVTIANTLDFTGTMLLSIAGGNTGTLSGVLQGTGGNILTTGAGTLVMSGSNTYTGGAVLGSGAVILASDSALGSGDALLGTVLVGVNNGISVSNNMGIVNTGTFLIGTGNTGTLSGALTGTGSLVKEGAGVLVLSGTNSTYSGSTGISAGTLQAGTANAFSLNSAVSLENVSGAILSLDGHNNTIATLSGGGNSGGNVSLGSGNLTFGTAADTSYAGVVAGTGKLIKQGTGSFTYTGVGTYTGGTDINAGSIALSETNALGSGTITMQDGTELILGPDISLSNGVALNGGNTIQTLSGDVTMSGVLSGATGALTKTGGGKLILSGANTYAGNTTVSGGTFAVNGSITSDTTIGSSSKLMGTGGITGDVVVNGTTAPGASIGTLTITGNYTQADNSTLEIEISPSDNDKLIVSGNVVIGNNVTFALQPAVGAYADGTQYEIVTAGGSVTGTFATITNTNIQVSPQLIYQSDAILLLIGGVSNAFHAAVQGHNAQNVAAVVDQIYASQPAGWNGLLTDIVAFSQQQLETAFNAMAPSQLKGLAVIQENNTVRIAQSVDTRFQTFFDEKACQNRGNCKGEAPFSIWVDGFGNFLTQGSNVFETSPQVGYRDNGGGVVVGGDIAYLNHFHTGVLGAYSYSSVDWMSSQGRGSIQTGYFGVYGEGHWKGLFLDAGVIAGWNTYKASRKIVFTGTDATATNTHSGKQISLHLDGGYNYTINAFAIRPYDTIDYIVAKEVGFTETGAGILNLQVQDSFPKLVRNELGLNVSGCASFRQNKVFGDAWLAWVREMRVGKSFMSQFINIDDVFETTGYFPARSLIAPGASFTWAAFCDQLIGKLYYYGEFGAGYNSQSVGVEIRSQF